MGRRQAAQAVALSLGLAYLLGGVGFARAPQLVSLDWIVRFEFWPSLALAAGALYLGGWLYGGWAGVAILCRQRSPRWVGPVAGVLVLLTAALVGTGWNLGWEVAYGSEAVHRWGLPGSPPGEYGRMVGYLFEDYVGKPLAFIMPLGSLLAMLLGWWFGRRVQARASRPAHGPAEQ